MVTVLIRKRQLPVKCRSTQSLFRPGYDGNRLTLLANRQRVPMLKASHGESPNPSLFLLGFHCTIL